MQLLNKGSDMTPTSEPKLDAPGAGLPAPELFIARKRFALKCLTGSREKFIEQFEEQQRDILALVDSVPVSSRNTPVLISRLRGLEDSSRHWSVWMTLEHLRITNTAFAHFISTLSKNLTPKIIADTAAVKPGPDLTIDVEEAFAESCRLFLSAVDKVQDLKTATRHNHPWFGPLDAFRWLALASLHLGIHRAQIEAIRSALQ